jgi:hypothetical protein
MEQDIFVIEYEYRKALMRENFEKEMESIFRKLYAKSI